MRGETRDDIAFAREVLRAEAAAVEGVLDLLGEEFGRAIEMISNCKGRVIVSGIGKAGIVGQKISATLASTGTPSYSVHPVEAVHGDLGRIVEGDIVVVLSNSGETEVVEIIPAVKRIGAKIIAITGNKDSTLASYADVVIWLGDITEPCSLGLAPSASTTAMLALGDAIALTVARKRKFDKEQYALFHPGGELGRSLLRVEEVMRGLDQCAVVKGDLSVTEALACIDKVPGRAGAVVVIDSGGKLEGIFTDGDLRRRIRSDAGFLQQPIRSVMTKSPKCVKTDSLAQEAANILKTHRIDELPVVDSEGRLRGILDVQDLLAVRVIAP